jgi:C-terminal processing protease CtpA/Prc
VSPTSANLMPRLLLSLVLIASFGASLSAQPPNTVDASLASFLNFENQRVAGTPLGWSGGPPGTLFADSDVTHGGKWAARVERTATSGEGGSALTRGIPLEVSGKRIELRGFLRTEDVSGWAGLWIRVDGETGMLAIDNMRARQLNGTTDWTEHSVSLPLNPAGRRLVFGALLNGTGKVWADDLQLLVDGKPIWEAPRKEAAPPTILERDKEFAAGSKIAIAALTPAQIEHLATLGQVWGFLKYHHPVVTGGERNWDFELFRVMPSLLAAVDHKAANEVLLRWIEDLGPVTPGSPVAIDESKLHFKPDHAWLEDETRVGPALRARLRSIAFLGAGAKKQFYVSLAPGVGNPVFENEAAHAGIRIPDSGYQLLGLFRFWNIIQYWFPYRNLLDENWADVLRDSIPRIGLAPNADAYKLEMIRLIARVHDTHANLWSSLNVRPPVGDGQLPAVIRFLENRAVITQTIPAAGEMTEALKRGDVIEAIGGNTVGDLVKTWSPYYAASNEPTRLRDIARAMGRGPAGPVELRIERGAEKINVATARVPMKELRPPPNTHDLAGPAFRLLSKDVAYLKMSAVKTEEARGYVEQAAGTKGWIIDIRNYPSSFLVFALGEHLIKEPTEFACFTTGTLGQPGAFSFTKVLSLKPRAPHYSGRIVILVDEVSQSSAEYTSMAFRVAPGAMVIGSTTAAADGNVSRIPLPGGLHSMISGIGVFYPDRRPTQRIGIIPDLEVKPTLAGIREGRDEVLEAALRQILGAETPADELRKLSVAQE